MAHLSPLDLCRALDQTEVDGLPPILAILVQHLLHDKSGRVFDGEKQGLVRHILAEGLSLDLECPSGVGAAVFAPELLQLLLQLLLATSTHHGLGV